jgi:NADH-quinone oxidoreductase subunit E
VAEADGKKPELLSAPKGDADDLKKIKGVGPGLEKALNEMGVYHFDQIARWTADEVAWVDQNLVQFKGRASRDDWVDQAKTLASGGETEFSRRVEKGDVYD